jgi:hypothetical protein
MIVRKIEEGSSLMRFWLMKDLGKPQSPLRYCKGGARRALQLALSGELSCAVKELSYHYRPRNCFFTLCYQFYRFSCGLFILLSEHSPNTKRELESITVSALVFDVLRDSA